LDAAASRLTCCGDTHIYTMVGNVRHLGES
jgi:hypothetical protein